MTRLLPGPALLLLAVLVAGGCSDSSEDDPPEADGSTASSASSGTSTSSAGPSGSDAPTTPPVEPGERPTPVDAPPEVVEQASDSAADYAGALTDILSDPGSAPSGPTAVDGVALEALEAQAAELEQSGLRLRGEPRIRSVEVYEHGDDEMVIGACVDNSRVQVVDQSGAVVSDGRGTPPTLNIFTLERRGSGWVVVGSTFPSDPDC